MGKNMITITIRPKDPFDHFEKWDVLNDDNGQLLLVIRKVKKGQYINITLKRKQLGPNILYSFFSLLFLKLSVWIGDRHIEIQEWWKRRKCKHPNMKEIHRDYQERFAILVCPDCEKQWYEDI